MTTLQEIANDTESAVRKDYKIVSNVTSDDTLVVTLPNGYIVAACFDPNYPQVLLFSLNHDGEEVEPDNALDFAEYDHTITAWNETLEQWAKIK